VNDLGTLHWYRSSCLVGLLIIGNSIIDKRYKEFAAYTVLEDKSAALYLAKRVISGTINNVHFCSRIGDAGRSFHIFSVFKLFAASVIRL
jgi:hypothetical protein